jgi:AraC-like DNA-binding protein
VEEVKEESEEYESQELAVEEMSPFVAKATEFVNAHLADTELTAEMMARELAMSRSKLFELMKQETGKSVMEFVRDLRLEYAARRLETGDSVAEITYACGFSDPSSFRRAFANKYGVTPSQYKTEHRKN